MRYDRLLEGKVAVVTSGAHGMGKHISQLFALQGARVVINGRDPSGEESAEVLRRLSPDSFFVRCDMSSRDEVDAFIRETLARTGGVDIVVNNVGINKHGPIRDIADEDFEYTQQVNLHGVLRMTRGFLPGMLARGKGAFVHISTIHSVAGLASFGSYASSKSAINALSLAIAADYGSRGVRSNIVCPGGVLTGDAPKRFAAVRDDPAKVLDWARRSSMSHPDFSDGSANDIARASLFLASDMARHVTGAVVMSDGGAHYQSHYFGTWQYPSNYDDLLMEHMYNRFELPSDDLPPLNK